MEIVAHGILSDVAPILESLDIRDAYVLLEELPTAWLEPGAQRQTLHFKRLTSTPQWRQRSSGQIFCPAFELRWEPVDGQVRVVYIGASPAPAGLHTAKIQVGTVREASYSLWGTVVDRPQSVGEQADAQVFAELRIPRLLRYPVPMGIRQVRIAVREYLEGDTNQLIATRFCGLQEEL